MDNKWITFSLDEEATVLNKTSNMFKVNVSDETFYNILGVQPGATSKEIKKSFFAKAKDLHPDKNPNNQEAADQFIELHEAYQTLIDPEKRIEYDDLGRTSSSSSSSSSGLDHFNVGVFFEILFGSQPVEKYVGQLSVSSFFSQLLKLIQASSTSTLTIDMVTSWLTTSHNMSLQRNVQVALHMRDFIQPFVNGSMSEQEFHSHCEKEAQSIADTSFGTTFLYHIGHTLVQESNLFLKQSWFGWPLWMLSSTKKSYYQAKGKVDGLRMVSKFLLKFVSFFDDEERTNIFDMLDKDNSKSRKLKSKLTSEIIEQMLPDIINLAWEYIFFYDISKLLEVACEKVLFDSKVGSFGERRRRARALRILGESFVKRSGEENEDGTCKSPDATAHDMKVRAEVAFRIAQQNTKHRSSESEEMIKKAQRFG
jgi:hypothetical protein